MSEAKAFSKPLVATSVPPEGLDVTLRPNEAERAALARANGLVAVEALEAHLSVRRRGADGLAVTGRLHAKVRQTCVVTLEEFDAEIEEPIETTFAPPHDASHRARKSRDEEALYDESGEDAPDPVIDGTIDLGALVSEFLTLGLDPYPRSPGATFVEPAPQSSQDGPFANLNVKLGDKGSE